MWVNFSLDIKGNWDLPNDLNAAVTHREKNYFYKGCKYYAYNGDSWKGSIDWTGDIRSKGGWNAECDLDAAVSWRGKTYLFKGDKVWTMEANMLISIQFITAVGVRETWKET